MADSAADPEQARKRWRPARVAVPIEQGRPFVRVDFDATAQTSWTLRSQYRRLFRGVYLPKDIEVTSNLMAEAALLLAGQGCYVSHHTAALLWGGVVPDDPDVHVTYRGPRARCFGIAAHRPKKNQRVATWRGIRTTSSLQTFLDMAQVLSLVDLVVLGDSLVKKKRFTPRELVAFVMDATGPHHRKAKRAAGLVRRGVDSPMETRLRLLIVFAGLPEPTVDHRIHDADGELRYRFDLSYLKYGLIIEYDGRQHAESTEQWHGDLDRDEQLDDWHIRRLVVVSSGIFNTPGKTLARITKAMRERGMTVPPLSDEWRRHFPSRPWDVDVPA